MGWVWLLRPVRTVVTVFRALSLSGQFVLIGGWYQISSWIGGSRFSKTKIHQGILDPATWISKEEYDTTGPAIVHSKCF